MFRCQFDDVVCRTNHDLAFERQLFCNRGAESRFADIFAHNKRADGADINHTELRQLFSDHRWLTSIRLADVYRAKKGDMSHRRSDG